MNVGTPNNTSNVERGSISSWINVLLGIWFFISPWVFGAYDHPNAWNAWLVGAAIIAVAGFRATTVASVPGLSWVNTVLAIWVFISPWVYGYTGNTARFVDSLCVGVLIFVLSIASASGKLHNTTAVPMHR